MGVFYFINYFLRPMPDLNKRFWWILKKLISFNSGCNLSNQEIINFIVSLFAADKRYQLTLKRIKKGDYYIYNLLIKLPGKNQSAPLIFAGHTDTVAADVSLWKGSPFNLKEQANKLYGLGISDMKGALALMLYQLLNIKTVPEQDIYLSLTADEEDTLLGIKSMAAELKRRKVKSALIILGEPSDGRIRLGQKACLGYQLALSNRQVKHAAYVSQAENIKLNVLQQAFIIIGRLNQWVAKINRQFGSSPRYGGVTFNLGRIQGGLAANSLPPKVDIKFEFRFPPLPAYKDLPALDKQIKKIITNAIKPPLAIKLTNDFTGGYYKLDANDITVKRLQKIYLALFKRPSSLFYGRGWTEAAYYQQFGKVVILGPGKVSQAHAPNEYIEREELVRVNQLYNFLINKI